MDKFPIQVRRGRQGHRHGVRRLAFVNGHSVIAPKPWRAIEGKTGAMEDDVEASAPEKPAAKEEAEGQEALTVAETTPLQTSESP